jgi:membrane protease YdiL (CAAX protease family)
MAYQFTSNAFISPQYAPTIGLILVCVMTKDWSAWRNMNWGLSKKPEILFWMFTALLLPVFIILISSLVMSSVGTPFVPWQNTTPGYGVIIITAILGCVFEEIGWRGYLLPKFAEKHTMFHSAIGIGLLWGVWHCKFSHGIPGFMLFVVLIVCFSILMTWIYMKTNGSLLCMVLFHFGVNISSAIFIQNSEGTLFYGLATILCVLICTPIVVKNKAIFFRKISCNEVLNGSAN